MTQAYKLMTKGDPYLLNKCQTVQFPLGSSVFECIDECKSTLRYVEGFWHRRAMSVAAPQVGYSHRLFLVCLRKNWYTENMYRQFQTIINPEIIAASEEKCIAWEGCISQADQLMLVERPKHIKVRFQTVKGIKDRTSESEAPIPTDLYLRGLMARIFQHEVDHLDGRVMWEEGYESDNFKVLDHQKTAELLDEEELDRFYKENAHYMLEY